MTDPPQVPGTLARFFAGRDDLLLVKIDLSQFAGSDKLKWETNAHGTFPHLFCPLDTSKVEVRRIGMSDMHSNSKY